MFGHAGIVCALPQLRNTLLRPPDGQEHLEVALCEQADAF